MNYLMSSSFRPITNLEYETRLNDEKRSIAILRRVYLDRAILDSVRENFRYKNSSDYISNNLKSLLILD